jgi:hypothetical protein
MRKSTEADAKRPASLAKRRHGNTGRSVLGEYGEAHPATLEKLTKFMLEHPGTGTAEHVERIATTIPIVQLPRTAGQ